MNELLKNHDTGCAEIMKMAERELAAYLNAVTALFGAQQAQLAAKDWLRELATTTALPVALREWRVITINATRRLATRLDMSKATLISPGFGFIESCEN